MTASVFFFFLHLVLLGGVSFLSSFLFWPFLHGVTWGVYRLLHRSSPFGMQSHLDPLVAILGPAAAACGSEEMKGDGEGGGGKTGVTIFVWGG